MLKEYDKKKNLLRCFIVAYFAVAENIFVAIIEHSTK